MAKSQSSQKTETKKKTRKKSKGKYRSKSDGLKAEIQRLKEELVQKNEVLQVYADHRNWVKPSEIREKLGIPEKDRSGNPIEEPTQCFVGARYPWEPALKVILGMEEREQP